MVHAVRSFCPHRSTGTRLAILATVFNYVKEKSMKWTAPAYTDLRFGFEITMYIANR